MYVHRALSTACLAGGPRFLQYLLLLPFRTQSRGQLQGLRAVARQDEPTRREGCADCRRRRRP